MLARHLDLCFQRHDWPTATHKINCHRSVGTLTCWECWDIWEQLIHLKVTPEALHYLTKLHDLTRWGSILSSLKSEECEGRAVSCRCQPEVKLLRWVPSWRSEVEHSTQQARRRKHAAAIWWAGRSVFCWGEQMTNRFAQNKRTRSHTWNKSQQETQIMSFSHRWGSGISECTWTFQMFWSKKHMKYVVS